MAQALWMRLRDVNWADYQTSAGTATRMPKLLQDLASRKAARAMRASQEVWKLLCSGGIHSAAAPSIPFLVDIAFTSVEDVKLEIYDILKSCAHSLEKTEQSEAWHKEAQENLTEARQKLGDFC